MRPALLVYDDRDSVPLLRAILEAEGLHTRLAPKDVRAAEALAPEAPALVVIDVAGPLARGLPFLQALRLDRRERREVLILATELDTETVIRARHAGATCCIGKPVSRPMLADAVTRLARKAFAAR